MHVSAHYPGTNSSANATKSMKKLWASEDYSTFNDDVGAGCWARVRRVCREIELGGPADDFLLHFARFSTRTMSMEA